MHNKITMEMSICQGTNYRRAVNDLERDGKLPVSFHTAHGGVMRSDCDEIKISPKTVGSAPIQIMPDGTGFKGCGYSTAATYWLNKMNCVGNVVINIGNYKCFSQNLGQ